MTAILAALPARLRPYAKAAVAMVGAFAQAAVLLWADEPAVVLAVAVLTALGVYGTRNGHDSDNPGS